MDLLQDRVVAVTGGGRGLGRAYAVACARAGARVVVNDHGGSRDGFGGADPRVAEEVVAEIRRAGGRAVASSASVANEEGARQLVELAAAEYGRLDVLVNNAGTVRDAPLTEMGVDDWDAVVDVHLRGTFLCCRFAVAQMMDQGDGGRIVNTTSMAGLIGNPGQSSYASAKAGVTGLTRTLALELARVGITVNAIAPLAKTRLTADVAEIGDESRAELVAPMVVYLASDLAKEVTGRVFGVHGGHIFEYRVEMTRGVDRGPDGWQPEEIAASLPAIGRSAAERWRRGDERRDAGPAVDATQASLGLAVFEALLTGFRPRRAGDWKAAIHFFVDRCGAFTLTVKEGRAAVQAGVVGEPTCEVTLDAATFFGMASGAIDGEEAFLQGKIAASNLSDLMQYHAVIHQRRARAAVAEVLAAHGVGPTGAPA